MYRIDALLIYSSGRLKLLRSGPSSMIELKEYEEEEEDNLSMFFLTC